MCPAWLLIWPLSKLPAPPLPKAGGHRKKSDGAWACPCLYTPFPICPRHSQSGPWVWVPGGPSLRDTVLLLFLPSASRYLYLRPNASLLEPRALHGTNTIPVRGAGPSKLASSRTDSGAELSRVNDYSFQWWVGRGKAEEGKAVTA